MIIVDKFDHYLELPSFQIKLLYIWSNVVPLNEDYEKRSVYIIDNKSDLYDFKFATIKSRQLKAYSCIAACHADATKDASSS